MEKIIFVDFDGTICNGRFWQNLPQHLYSQVQEILFIGRKDLVNEWMCGKINYHKICDYLATELKVEPSRIEESLQRSCESMELIPGCKEVLAAIPHKRILITTNMDVFNIWTVPALTLNSMFDEIINSSDVGYLKTDYGGKIFLEQTKLYDTSVENCVLLDDSKNVCKTFSDLGGTTHQIKNINETVPYLKMYI